MLCRNSGTFWVIVKKESNSFSALVLWCSVSYPSRFLGSCDPLGNDVKKPKLAYPRLAVTLQFVAGDHAHSQQ